MSEIKTNKISPRKGTTQTIGDSGDTVTIASGATLSNAGTISGLQKIDWDTTKKTSAFTAANGVGYFVDTTSTAITVTFPASPSAGNVIGIKDYANTFDTNNLTINSNGNKIQGSTENFIVSVEGTAANFIYVDSTRGWVLTDASKASDIAEGPTFTVATGGTITTCGDYKIHTFTGPGTFCVSSIGNGPTVPTGGPNTVSYMVVAGGAGGGTEAGGGGGAGGFREGRDIAPSYTASPLVNSSGLTITTTSYPVTVGGGGTPPGGPAAGGGVGSDSIFSTITATGGGGGGAANPSPTGNTPGVPTSNGGSGGGGSRICSQGTGNTPPVSPPQGNNGGAAGSSVEFAGGGGGGGGATAAGSNVPAPRNGGNGGAGATTSISGSSTTYAGGGGGAGNTCVGSGGPGGGGSGGNEATPGTAATAGTANTGGGGGGMRNSLNNPGRDVAGGSGIVIIRYKYQ